MRAGPRWLGAGLLAAFCILVGLEPPPLGRMRDAVFDTYQRVMPRVPRSMPATIVEIDERTLDEHGQWPWPRSLVAQLIGRIAAAGPAPVPVPSRAGQR